MQTDGRARLPHAEDLTIILESECNFLASGSEQTWKKHVSQDDTLVVPRGVSVAKCSLAFARLSRAVSVDKYEPRSATGIGRGLGNTHGRTG